MQHLRNCTMVQRVSINTVLAAVEQCDASEAKPDANGITTAAEGISVEERKQYQMVQEDSINSVLHRGAMPSKLAADAALLQATLLVSNFFCFNLRMFIKE